MEYMDISLLKFLVVDDHLMVRELVTRTLAGQNAKLIDIASNGEEALKKITTSLNASNPYNVVFLDWNMPKMDGFEMLAKCRCDDRLNDMAIIMLTAESDEANIIKALSAGATAYIVKPFKEEVILKRLENIVSWLEK